MADPRTTLSDVVAEKTTCLISGTLVDETGVALGSSQLASFKMTLYSLSSGMPILNNRTAVDILNAGPGTVDVNGAWLITLTPADNAIAGGGTSERHRLLLEWTWAAGVKAGKHEVDFIVRNLAKVVDA